MRTIVALWRAVLRHERVTTVAPSREQADRVYESAEEFWRSVGEEAVASGVWERPASDQSRSQSRDSGSGGF